MTTRQFFGFLLTLSFGMLIASPAISMDRVGPGAFAGPQSSESLAREGGAETTGSGTRQSEADRTTPWRVAEIYLATMGYAPDADGHGYWIGTLQTDPAWNPTTVAQSFFDQPLVQAEYPEHLGYGPLIEALYLNIFDRTPDSVGYSYWLGELQSGRVLRNQMVIALIEGGWDNPEAATDMARFGNRIRVALAFAEAQRDLGIVYGSLSPEDQERLRQAGRDVVEGIGSGPSDHLIGIARIDELLLGIADGGADRENVPVSLALAHGPLANAEVRAYRIRDPEREIKGLIYTDTVSARTPGAFRLEIPQEFDNEWILVAASGGFDTIVETENRGTVHALAPGYLWRTEGIHLTPLTDALYRQLIDATNITTASNEEVQSILDVGAREWVRAPSADTVVSYRDVLSVRPDKNSHLLRVDPETFHNRYVSAIYRDTSPFVLAEIAHYLILSQNGEYARVGPFARIVLNGDNADHIIEISERDEYENSPALYGSVRTARDGILASTRIVSKTPHESKIALTFLVADHTLTLYFTADQRIVRSLDQEDLRRIADYFIPSFRVERDGAGEFLEIRIPNEIMASFDASDLFLSLNGTYFAKDLLTVFRDNPIIGWYFNESHGSEHIPYEIPQEHFERLIQVYFEPVVLNTGNVEFRWIEDANACPSGEADIGTVTSKSQGEYSAEVGGDLWRLCLSHPAFSLDTVATSSGTTIYSYGDGKVWPLRSGPTRSIPVNVTVGSANHDIRVVYGPGPYPGYSCGLSLESATGGHVGDCDYASNNRLWVGVFPKTAGRYQLVGNDLNIVRDVETGLEWMRCSLGQSWSSVTQSCTGDASLHFFDDALLQPSMINARGGYGGRTDWRVPTNAELKTLVYCSNTGQIGIDEGSSCNVSPDDYDRPTYDRPTILQEVFPNTPAASFWTATPDDRGSLRGWEVSFSNGADGWFIWVNLRSVRLVRGGK